MSRATASVRYTFTGQFLQSSAVFVRRARVIENSQVDQSNQDTICEHRGLVCSVIMQCAAALETEADEICVHGPGAYLGSGRTDTQARDFLQPVADVVDARRTIERFDIILHLLRKPAIRRGSEPYQSAALVVDLRNEIVHYKSRTNGKTKKDLEKALRSHGHSHPPFVSPNQNFYPHRCLSADCAEWALTSVVGFLDSTRLLACQVGLRATVQGWCRKRAVEALGQV